MTVASETENSDLWRALKGGGNNFGIVTRFTIRTFPNTPIWSGFLYLPAFQAEKALAALHEFVGRVNLDNPGTNYDEYAAGPLVCFTYLSKLNIQAISVNLVYTKPPETSTKWPHCWKTSSFSKLWRFWSTCKVRSLTSATDELNTLNPPGRRQAFATTTVRNDLPTIVAAHAAYRHMISSIRQARIKDVSGTIVLQPLLSAWASKGDPNPLGLGEANEQLIIVIFTVNWQDWQHDDLVPKLARNAIEQIDNFAAARKTGHPYRYLNYCASWQQPFLGYGANNQQFLQDVSRKYDQDGLFQKGCIGGFKLDMSNHEM